MKRREWLGLAALSGCGRKSSSKIRVSVGDRITMAPIYLARERGYFRDAGLDVEFTVSNSSRDALTLLAGGEFDVALFSMTPATPNAIARGARIRVVAGRETLTPGCSDNGALRYRQARYPSGPDDASAWPGSRIATSGDGLNNLFYVDEVMAGLGVDRRKVEIEKLGYEEALAALAGGHIDMSIGGGRPTFLAGGLPKGVKRSDIVERTVGEYQYSHVLFGRGLLDAPVERGSAFLKAYLRGAAGWVAGDTPRFIDDFARDNKLDVDVIKRSCRKSVSTTGEITHAHMERWLRWALANRHIEQPVTSGKIADTRFIDALRNAV